MRTWLPQICIPGGLHGNQALVARHYCCLAVGSVVGVNKNDGQKMWPLGLFRCPLDKKSVSYNPPGLFFLPLTIFFPLNLYINLNIFILNLNIYKFKYINLNIYKFKFIYKF